MKYDTSTKQVIDPDTDQLIDNNNDNNLIGFTLDHKLMKIKPTMIKR
jgi:hypothetical protein